MRRKEAASSCLVIWPSCLWLTGCLLVLVLFGCGVEGTEIVASYGVTVTTAESLREALVNRNVSIIYLGQDITLSRTEWETGHLDDPESGIVVERNLTLTSHPSLTAPAVLHLDYMKNRVLAGTDMFLMINGVVMTGVSDDARNYFFVPFFQFQPGGTVFIQNSQYSFVIDPSTLWPLEAYPSRMNSTARPNGFEDWPVEVRVVSEEECEENYLREVSCQDRAIWVGTLSARLTVFDKDLLPIGKAAFLASNVLMTAHATGEGKLIEYRAVFASTPQEFKKALQNPVIREIQILQDLNLTQEVFPSSSRTLVTRNLTIGSSPQMNRSAVVNFNYLEAAVVAGSGVQITLFDLNFIRASKDPQQFELVPFFAFQPGATYTYRNIVSEMALSPEELYPLNQLPYVLYGGDVPENYKYVLNRVQAVNRKWCAKDGRIVCPDGALWIIRGIRSFQVVDAYKQELLGHGFIDTQNTLIKMVDVSKKVYNPETASAESVAAEERQVDENGDPQSSESGEKRKSFGFIGGFDPWILIYALVAAAMILGCCLFILIVRRKRDQRRFKGVATVRSEDSFESEDDGMNAHQKIARQLLGDVKLGTLLGCGSFGRVYKAMWSGAQVAVKVILHQEDEAEVEQEAQFSISLRHPNVVQTFHYGVRTVDAATPTPKKHSKDTACVVDIDSRTSSSPIPADNGMNLPSSWMKSTNGGQMFKNSCSATSEESVAIPTENQSQTAFSEERWLEMWLIQEFCNLGSLGKQNYLRINDQHSAWGSRNPDMQIIVDTCKDIARGMKYLHDNGIVHGDLKCDNLLLQSSHVDQKGFTAKVADFGLSRKLGPSTHLSTKSFGTITHMPPELLLDGHLSSKVDVYSFGVIMWELVTGSTPFRDLRYAEVMRAIVVDNKRPLFAAGTSEEYVSLATRCWDRTPSRRPSFGAVLVELDKMSKTVQTPSNAESTCSWESGSEDGYT